MVVRDGMMHEIISLADVGDSGGGNGSGSDGGGVSSC